VQFSARRGNGKEGKTEKRTLEREVYSNLFPGHFHFSPFPYFRSSTEAVAGSNSEATAIGGEFKQISVPFVRPVRDDLWAARRLVGRTPAPLSIGAIGVASQWFPALTSPVEVSIVQITPGGVDGWNW
jgi:hypothetical protein